MTRIPVRLFCRMKAWIPGLMLCGVVAASLVPLRGQSAYATWSDYGGSSDSSQDLSLTQINKNNVTQLRQAWFHPVPDRQSSFSFSPIVVDKVMYVLGAKNAIVALDATTGKHIWSHIPEGGSPGNRGINYWESKD